MKTYLRALGSVETSWKDRSRSLVTLCVAVAMSVFAIFIAYKVRTDITGTFTQLGGTRNMQAQVNDVTSGVIDAQSSLRGYHLTRDVAYLAPYERAKKTVPALVAALKNTTVEPAIAEDVQRFTQTAMDNLIYFSERIEQAKQAPANYLPAKADMDNRQQRIETLRIASADLQQAIQDQLSVQRTGIDKAAALLLTAVAVLVVGLGLIAAAQARELVMQNVRHNRHSKEASATIASLSDSVSQSRAEKEGLNRQLRIALRSAKVQVFGITRTGTVEWVSDSGTSLAADQTLPFNLFDLVASTERDMLASALASSDAPDISIRITDQGGKTRYYKLNFAEDAASRGNRLLGSAVDISDLKQREENSFWLMRELSHRSKNLLAIVQSIARQTANTTASVEEFQKRFTDRLGGLASAHDLLVKTSYSGADLRALIISQLGSRAAYLGERIHLNGPDITIRHEAAQNIAMAMQELASNAAIHGALATQDGKITLDWSIGEHKGESALYMTWRETGVLTGANGNGNGRKAGFGTSLITKNLPRSLDGEVRLTHTGEGTECEMILPMRRLTPEAILPQVTLS